jgi:hypothetical protein
VLPFGLRNTQAMFDRLLNKVLRLFIEHIAKAYMENVLVNVKKKEQNMMLLEKAVDNLKAK